MAFEPAGSNDGGSGGELDCARLERIRRVAAIRFLRSSSQPILIMKTNDWRLLALGMIALWATLPGIAGEAKPVAMVPASADLAFLDKFRSADAKGFLEGNAQERADFYAENFRLMPEYQRTILGRAAATAYHMAFAARFQVREYHRERGETIELGAQVMETGRLTLKLVLKSSGQERDLVGKYLDLWTRTAGGRLSLLTEVWNYDQPLEFADELRFPEVPAVQIAFQAHVPVKGGVSFELAALNQLLEVAIIQHDAAVWSQVYADDAVLMANYSPLHVGRKAIDDYIAEHVRQLPVFEKLDLRNDRIDDLGGFVVEYASHVANWRNGDSSGVNTGKDLRIWRREPNGALKIFRHIGAYD